MIPKVIKNDEEYQAASKRAEFLRGLGAGPEKETELELWAFLIDRYEKTRLETNLFVLTASSVSKRTKMSLSDLFFRRRWNAPLKTGTFLFFGFTASLLFFRLMYLASYFPPFFEGEESQPLDLAKGTYEYAVYSHSWWVAFTGGLIEYNKGFAWALVPFYSAFGYDVRIITYVLPIIFSLLCATFFTIYRKAYPKSSVLSFFLVVLFSVLCVSLRRYKWHAAAYIAAISIYLYFLPEFYKGAFFLRDRWRKALSIFLFAVSCYLYFGSFLYVAPFFILIVFFSSKLQRKKELALGCLGLVLFAAVFFVTCHTTERWRTRIGEELSSIKADVTLQGLQYRWWATRDFLFTMDLTIPYLVIFVAGLVASFNKIRRGDRFALINTTLLFCIWAFQLAIEGLNNPDQLNWSMIPLLGILLIGADEIFRLLRDKLKVGSICCSLIVFCVGWNELRHYLPLSRDAPFQAFVQARNTRSELALVLMMIKADDSGLVQYYLPAISVSEADGGFGYNPSLLRVDFADAFVKVHFFANEEDLRKKLLTQQKGKEAVVYLSVGYPPDGAKDTVNMPLLGHAPEIIHPFEDVYEIPYMVRRYQFPPGRVTLGSMRSREEPSRSFRKEARTQRRGPPT